MRVLCFLLSLAYANSFHITSDSSRKEKIVGGKIAKITDVPYQATFEYEDAYNCGAVIISNTWILSAAHCFINRPKLPAYGKIRTGTSHYESDGQLSQIEKIIPHPDYNQLNDDNDIALVQLKRALTFNKNQNSIPIVKANEVPKEGKTMKISGFGQTNLTESKSPFLKVADLTVIADSTCEKVYRYFSPITNNMFCAESKPNDACGGDSGGPGVIDGKLAGIISTGYLCATGTYPGVYTKVHKYYDWIVEKTGLSF